mmetsp:Transcript_22773/g.74136  ORF Transcript_22773/g.74136 Transcript_22773/m.74136 type:complete len:881 (+) Transcript_22773:19-2661(+)
MSLSSSTGELLPSEADLVYEEELLRTPYSLRLWCRYLDARKDASARKRYLLYERALRSMPASYKLWYAYLRERLEAVRGLRPGHTALEALSNTFERAFVTMNKMPRIWELYLGFLLSQKLVTRTRHACDRALHALPVTQHERVWTLYLKFVRQEGIPVETAQRVYRRYLKLEPGHAEEYIEFLKQRGFWNEAAQKLAEIVNDDTFTSLAGKSKHQLWLELCDLITKHPAEVKGLKVEAILRGGIRKFTDEVGRLWTALADFFIRRSLFEKARDVYEEGLTTVITVRDFSLIFDAYTQFEESMLSAKMELMDDESGDVGAEDDEARDAEKGNTLGEDFLLREGDSDVDLRLARLEHLMERRPELLSSVMLRQNPHNVPEWQKRVKLFEGQPTRQILTFTEAVKTIDPGRALGKPHVLWVEFANFYESHGDLRNARVIFEKAVEVAFKMVDELASVYCAWAEMELQHKKFPEAIAVLERATAVPASRPLKGKKGEVEPVQMRVHRSLKVWNLLVDLEESLGTHESTCRVYDRILDLRIATPQIVLNYANMLMESKHFEDAFRVFERGVSAFRYPHAKEIWDHYLEAFVARYGGRKLERARDLFEQAIVAAPPSEAKALFIRYAKLEEEHGLVHRAMEVYDRACSAVPDAEKLSVYAVYVEKARESFGVGKVRSIYEAAIEATGLPDDAVRTLCLHYAQLERSLGEIDRSRALFIHGSQFANPASTPGFWDAWNTFEVRHGNEDTFREMLRIKRSVAASYTNMHFNMSTIELPADAAGAVEAGVPPAGAKLDDMAALEQAAAEAEAAAAVAPSAGIAGFVSAGQEGGTIEVDAANPEEIDLGDDLGDDLDEDELQQIAVPDAVFGGVKGGADDEPSSKKRRVE